MIELIVVAAFFALTVVCVVIFMAKTTWHAQRRQADMEADLLAMKLASTPETVGLARQALDRRKLEVLAPPDRGPYDLEQTLVQ